MDDPKAVILDISSDDESGFGLSAHGGDEFGFISELFGEDDDDNNDKGDSDEVVVVGEVFLNRKQRMMKFSNTLSKSVGGGDADGDDEDCVVLDGDPDKPGPKVNEKEGDDTDSEELVVISEKGEVACRDFPHARHLCAKFPFASSPHENHCDQCHCYVCDSLAPCVYWGTGVSSMDHCNATDKDELWKAQRRTSLRGVKALPVPAVADKNFPMSSPSLNQSSLLTSNFIHRNQVARPATVRPCSMRTISSMLNATRQGRTQHPVYAVPRSKFQPNLVSRHLHGTSNHLRDRRHNNIGLQPPRVMLKRIRSVRSVVETDVSDYRSPDHNYGFTGNPPSAVRWQGSLGGPLPVSDAYHDSYQTNVGQTEPSMSSQTELPTQPLHASANNMHHHPQMPNQQNASSGHANYSSPHPQMCSQQNLGSGYANYVPQVAGTFTNPVPSSPQYGACGFEKSFPSPPQVASQSFVGCSYENPLPTHSQVPLMSEQNGDRTYQYSEPSQPRASWQFEGDNTFQCLVPSQSMACSLPNVESNSGNLLSPHEPQLCSQPNAKPDSSRISVQQGNQTIDAMGSNSAVSDFSWLTNSPSNLPPSIDNSQTQRAGQSNNLSIDMESQLAGSPGFVPLDLPFDDWFSEHETFSEAMEVPLTSGLNIPSPEPGFVDGGLFFQF